MKAVVLSLLLVTSSLTEIMDRSIGVYCQRSCTVTLHDFNGPENNGITPFVPTLTVQHDDGPMATVWLCTDGQHCKTLTEVRAFVGGE